MKARRAVIIASLVAAAAFLALFVFLTTISAQPGPPPPPPPGGPMDMGGPPGMPGPGGGGASLAWSETAADPLLVMSYPEFLARRGLRPSPIPEGLLKDDKGDPKKRTDAEWAQLDSLYTIDRAASRGPVPPGRVGGALYNQTREQLGVIIKETTSLVKTLEAIDNGFTFKIGYPRYDPSGVNQTDLTVRIGVLMQVKPSVQRNFGSVIYKAMQPFDNYGTDRRPFTFVTYQGGYFHPHTFTLHPDSIALWNSACAKPGIVLVLKDARGNLIDIEGGIASAGFDGNLPTLIAYPPEVRRTPAFGYLMPNDDRTFDGRSRLGLDYARGWYYDFTFTLPREELRKLDQASAFMVMPPQSKLLAALTQADTVAELQPSYETAFRTWLQEYAEKMFGRGSRQAAQMQSIIGSGQAAGAGGPGAMAPGAMPPGAPGAPPPPPGVGQLAPGGVGAGYQTPPLAPTAPVPL